MPQDQDDPDHQKTNVLMVGPLPPPQGGVANFVRNIRDAFLVSDRYAIDVYRTGPTGPLSSKAAQVKSDLGQMLRFFREFRARDPGIVHIHTASYYSFWRNVPYAIWTRYLSGAHLIIHVHGGGFREFHGNAVTPLRYMIGATLRMADAVIVTSPSWTSLIQEITGSAGRVQPLPNGFEPGIFRPIDKIEARKELGIPTEGKMLVAIGYLEDVKGHRHLIEAMGKVCRQEEDVRLYVIGDGSLREQLAAMVRERDLEGHVTFVYDPQPSAKVALWMNAADVFVLPSLNEGNPTVMFECLGCGRPFVGTAVGGIPDVIVSEDLGMLCKPADPDELAEAITGALGRQWDEEQISMHAQQYSWPNIISKLSLIYDEVSSSRRGR